MSLILFVTKSFGKLTYVVKIGYFRHRESFDLTQQSSKSWNMRRQDTTGYDVEKKQMKFQVEKLAV